MSTIFSIHPKPCAFKLKYNLFPLIHLVRKYFTAVHRFINFWYCVCVFIYRVKLDYHISKRLQPQHIERDKNSSPISAGINFFFFCSFWMHLFVWFAHKSYQKKWSIELNNSSCDVFKQMDVCSSMRKKSLKNTNDFNEKCSFTHSQ